MKIPLELAPGLVSDDTDFSTGGWRDGSNVRFWRGKPETVKGWESLTLTLLAGVCRTVWGWSDSDNLLNFALGCHNNLTVWQNGELAVVTPVSVAATGTITVSGTPVANETFVVGTQTFTFKASRAVAGEVTISAVNATQATNIVAAITADIPSTATAAAVSAVVTVTATTAGVAGNLIVLTEAATGIAVSGSGKLSGGSGFVTGQIDGTGSVGYGTGAYGVGDYGEPSTIDYFPLTWSYGSRLGVLYANPRGQGIFKWENVTSAPATALSGAPAAVNSILVSWTGQVMAFGCTDTSGLFNPSCIRISDIVAPTTWTISTSSTAQQFYLEGNGRIVGARAIGQYVFVWTDSELHIGVFTDSWSFQRAGAGGLCGPNAAVVVGQTAYWVSPDLQFYSCPLGGAPVLLVCPIREDFAENAAPGQNDKIVAASVAERGEVVWFYADGREGYENSRAVRLSTVDGAWMRDDLARTAFVDSNPGPSPVGVTYGGAIYWHERGSSADGGVLASSLRSGGQYMDPASRMTLLRGLWPDFKDQVGAINLTIYTRDYPQDEETVWGPFVIPASTNKIDFLVSGRIFDFEFSSSSSPSAWRMGKPVFDAVITGER
ncbi:hypothetical protein UFOVP679_62 [uncultured Caudovirales phage]|uniref:Uncharacterized protein n=1 Tax=uncultured Caudovirales phage TaxID=2100421 RepID=A0A6J5NJQ6_9CAUD|nr:hypothetical protein UFOVP679_62 [uncultured Caudovirales phage]